MMAYCSLRFNKTAIFSQVSSPVLSLYFAVMGDLAHVWENSSVIRSRFRKSWSWLQWPYYAVDALKEETDDDQIERHPVCTKSLELNAEALIGVLDWALGGFCDIPALQREVRLEILHDLPLF